MPVKCKDGLVAQLVNLAGTVWCTRFDSDPDFVTSRGVSVVDVQQKILSGFVVYATPGLLSRILKKSGLIHDVNPS